MWWKALQGSNHSQRCGKTNYLKSVRKDKFWLVPLATPVSQRLSQWALHCMFPISLLLLFSESISFWTPGHYVATILLPCAMLAGIARRLIAYICTCSKCNGEQQSSPCFFYNWRLFLIHPASNFNRMCRNFFQIFLCHQISWYLQVWLWFAKKIKCRQVTDSRIDGQHHHRSYVSLKSQIKMFPEEGSNSIKSQTSYQL